MKFMTIAVTFECQTNTRGSQVVSVRPMGWAVCMVIMWDTEPMTATAFVKSRGWVRRWRRDLSAKLYEIHTGAERF